MVNYMEELSVTEAENLKKTISALFRQTCILQVKYDPVTLTPRDNLHYEICVTMAEWKDALYVMSKHQIIEVPGAIQNVEDQTKIYIYSTINLYCSGVDIQALMKEYVDEEGGAEVEAGEEDIYKNADE